MVLFIYGKEMNNSFVCNCGVTDTIWASGVLVVGTCLPMQEMRFDPGSGRASGGGLGNPLIAWEIQPGGLQFNLETRFPLLQPCSMFKPLSLPIGEKNTTAKILC